MLYQRRLARIQTDLATAKYHRVYNNVLYTAATKGKSVAFANALTNEALAICGHPYYKLSRRHWGEDAKEFLWWFSQNDTINT